VPDCLEVPTNADQRRSTPTSFSDGPGPGSGALHATIAAALPLLMRARVLDAVLAAQAVLSEPVTSAQARAARPVMRHARAFTELARAIARLGPDERGRVLCPVLPDRKGFARWWVQEQPSGPEA
jgi:hypothetical protein